MRRGSGEKNLPITAAQRSNGRKDDGITIKRSKVEKETLEVWKKKTISVFKGLWKSTKRNVFDLDWKLVVDDPQDTFLHRRDRFEGIFRGLNRGSINQSINKNEKGREREGKRTVSV